MLDLERLVRILWAAEQASAKGVSAVDFTKGSEPMGRLTAQKGRMCWATARNQIARVSDIFAEECRIPREQLEKAFQAARTKQAPFGEELVARGFVEEDHLRRTLRRQMVAALSALSDSWGGDASASWSSVGIPDVSYDPSFTVPPLELLLSCLERTPTLREEAGELPLSFSKLAPQLSAAICFRETGSADIPLAPVAWVNVQEMPIGAALSLGREAMGVARPVALAAASIHPYGVLVHQDGEGIVCAHEDPHLCVFEVRERAQYGELMAHLLGESRGGARGA